MQIKIEYLPSGWYTCQIRHDTLDFFKTNSLYPSLEAAYLAIAAYDKKGTDIDLPKEGDIEKLREKVEERYQSDDKKNDDK